MSTFYSYVAGSGQTSTDGLPVNITTAGFNHSYSSTARLNVDDTLRPSLLLHVGMGYVNTQVSKLSFPQVASFDQPGQLGLNGAVYPRLPASHRRRRFLGERRTDWRYDLELRLEL